MNKYSIYKIATGQIDRMISTPEDINIQLQEGEAYVLDHWNDTEYMVVNGKPTPLPLRPSDQHIFDYERLIWHIPVVTYTMEEVRMIRDQKLKDSDWTQFPDSPLSEEQRARWRDYRQALRDLPENYQGNFPEAPQKE